MYTVPRLKQMAKDRGHPGYSKLRRDELLNLFNPPPLPRQNVPRMLDQNAANINEPVLDTPVPYISTPVLTPSKTTKVQLKSMAKCIYDAVRKKTNEFADWMLGYVPESIKKPINKRVESLKQQVSDIFRRCYPEFHFRESKSALKGVTKQHTIDGKEGYDPESFMNAVKSQVVGMLSINRQNKFNFVLTCVMERVDRKTGEVDSCNVPFATKAEVVLESTDVAELYDNAIDKIA